MNDSLPCTCDLRQVIPQFIARIHISKTRVREAIHDLLCTIGKQYPQALLFPLTVAANNMEPNRARFAYAKQILDKMQDHSADLVAEVACDGIGSRSLPSWQARMVSEELIRVAVLWGEMWHELLEDASKLYHAKEYDAMLAQLIPLHQKMLDVRSLHAIAPAHLRRAALVGNRQGVPVCGAVRG